MNDHKPTAYLERLNGGWLLSIAIPAETAILALEMIDELLAGLRTPGDDTAVAAATGSLVGLLEELRIRSTLDALKAARTAA